MRVLTFAVSFALVLAGCGGGGGRSAPPAVPGIGSVPSAAPQGSWNVTFTITLSTTTAGIARKPNTVSPSSQSVGISVNGGSQTFFNITPPCPCNFTVGAPYGSDVFVISTFSGTNGSGTLLNLGVTSLNVTPSGPNSASATLGNVDVVTTTADSGAGSLRAVIAAAASGDAIVFNVPKPATITLTSGEIDLSKNITIAGSGSPSAPDVTISGNNASLLLPIQLGDRQHRSYGFHGCELERRCDCELGDALDRWK